MSMSEAEDDKARIRFELTTHLQVDFAAIHPPQIGPITGPNNGPNEYMAIARPLSSVLQISPKTPPPTYKDHSISRRRVMGRSQTYSQRRTSANTGQESEYH